jgi:hypothetical protein
MKGQPRPDCWSVNREVTNCWAGVVLARLLKGAELCVGSKRGERQQGAEEHREGGPEHEQTKCV